MSTKRGVSEVTEGSGNVFEDLGLPESDQLLAKARLASAISDILAERKLTQVAAAELLGATQPDVSNLVNGRLEGFSLERLTRFLNVLDRDIEIVVRPRAHSRDGGRIRVTLR